MSQHTSQSADGFDGDQGKRLPSASNFNRIEQHIRGIDVTKYFSSSVRPGWVGLSRPGSRMAAPGVSVVETDGGYEISVPLGFHAPEHIDIDLNDHMLVVSSKPAGLPSDDLDDVFAGERTAPLIHYIVLENALERDSVRAVQCGDVLLISVRRA
jgi:HSP20 family molecular chaperone IbpA